MEQQTDFDAVYQEYQPRIQRYLTRLSGETEAADLTQTVFLKVSRSLNGFRGESSLATWIYRIATNTAHDHAASSLARQIGAELLFADDGSVDDHPDSSSLGTDREYIRREMNACIRGVVDRLPENYRTALLLSEFEEFTNAEIAAILYISLDTVKIRLHRGRAALRKAMECQCSFYHDEHSELMCDRKPK
ncbi:MAG TPA: sigma-70 family RNA polymerase sigma factor [Dongiaceae bacterium]|nr:sigma-70 family RNA polymerase sigma factor [Dongiaceae bacterium]